jgi:hypothetical protein
MVVLKLSTWIILPLPHVTTRNKMKLAINYEFPSKSCTLSSSEMLQRKLQPRAGMTELHPCWKRQKGNKWSQTGRILSKLKAWMFISVIVHPTFWPWDTQKRRLRKTQTFPGNPKYNRAFQVKNSPQYRQLSIKFLSFFVLRQI